ncbi:MAG: branched-chain amino acid ABC transporter permease [Dehalococcoidales bacterium]
MEPSGLLSFMAGFATMAAIYAIFALGLNLQWGYSGLFNIGIAGFFAIGAYASALVTLPEPKGALASYVFQVVGLNQPFPIGVLAAGIISGIIALIIGIITLRLREDYLAIATLGIAESIRLIFNNERWLANGPQGLIGLPRPLAELVAPGIYHYLYLGIVALFLVMTFLFIEHITRSPWGRVLRAIRDDEVLAATSGKNVVAYKLQALVVGAFIMGIGGALYAHSVGAIQPGTFEPLFGTFIIWVMLTLGGTGNNKGAILGAFAVWAIWAGTEFLTDRLLPPMLISRAPYIRTALIGIMLAALLAWRPRGLLPEERQVSRLLK